MSGPIVLVDWNSLEASRPRPGITAVAAAGAQLSAARYLLEPGAIVPEHAHDNEEFGQIIAGSLQLTVGGTTTTLNVGDAFIVPGGVPHAAQALAQGCELLECYAPPRLAAAHATGVAGD